MKKINGLMLILKLIFPVFFNLIFFIAFGFRHNSIIWISYAFTHFAYFMLMLTPLMVTKSKNSVLFGFSVYGISFTYFILQLIIGIGFIAVTFASIRMELHIDGLRNQVESVKEQGDDIIQSIYDVDLPFSAFLAAYKDPINKVYNLTFNKVTQVSNVTVVNPFAPFAKFSVAFIIQMILAVLYGFVLIPNIIANEHTAKAGEKRQIEIDYIKNASLKLRMLLSNISDKEAAKKVEKVYDAISSSPVKSHPSIAQIEEQIFLSVNALETAIVTNNKDGIISLADSLLIAVNERNMRLRTLN